MARSVGRRRIPRRIPSFSRSRIEPQMKSVMAIGHRSYCMIDRYYIIDQWLTIDILSVSKACPGVYDSRGCSERDTRTTTVETHLLSGRDKVDFNTENINFYPINETFSRNSAETLHCFLIILRFFILFYFSLPPTQRAAVGCWKRPDRTKCDSIIIVANY